MLNAVSGWEMHKNWSDFVALTGILLLIIAAIIQYVDWGRSKLTKARIETIKNHIDFLKDEIEEIQSRDPMGPGHQIRGLESDAIDKIMHEGMILANRNNKKIMRELIDKMDKAEGVRDHFVRLSFAFLVVGTLLTGFPIIFSMT